MAKTLYLRQKYIEQQRRQTAQLCHTDPGRQRQLVCVLLDGCTLAN